MEKRAKEYEEALQNINAKVSEYKDVFMPTECDAVLMSGPELTRRETLLMHILDNLNILKKYNARGDNE